jgi:hypothetical protein
LVGVYVQFEVLEGEVELYGREVLVLEVANVDLLELEGGLPEGLGGV